MNQNERERRLREKAKRVPKNDVTLVVQKGFIDQKAIFGLINKKYGGQNG